MEMQTEVGDWVAVTQADYKDDLIQRSVTVSLNNATGSGTIYSVDKKTNIMRVFTALHVVQMILRDCGCILSGDESSQDLASLWNEKKPAVVVSYLVAPELGLGSFKPKGVKKGGKLAVPEYSKKQAGEVTKLIIPDDTNSDICLLIMKYSQESEPACKSSKSMASSEYHYDTHSHLNKLSRFIQVGFKQSTGDRAGYGWGHCKKRCITMEGSNTNNQYLKVCLRDDGSKTNKIIMIDRTTNVKTTKPGDSGGPLFQEIEDSNGNWWLLVGVAQGADFCPEGDVGNLASYDLDDVAEGGKNNVCTSLHAMV